MSKLFTDLFVPPGRTNRINYAIGLAVLTLSMVLQSWAVGVLGNSLISFMLGLFWLCLNLYMMYSLFARRLHDMDLSVGPFFATIFITLLVIAFTVWAGGGGEYFEAMMADPTIAEDEAASRELIEAYQANMKASIGWARWVNLLPFIALALFCLLRRGSQLSNKYGAPS